MKVFVMIFLLILVSGFLERSSGALPNVGSCTYREYNNKVRSCTTAFFLNVRRDPNGQCSTKVAAFKDCFVKTFLQCRSSVSESLIRSIVNNLVTEETVCHNAGISDPDLHPQKGQVPCSSTYFQRAYGCYNETLVLWRTNKADSRLCSVYSKAITCEKTLIDRECWYTGVNKELIDLNYDGYNPFCAASGVQPGVQPGVISWKSTASRKSIHDGLMLILSLLPWLSTWFR